MWWRRWGGEGAGVVVEEEGGAGLSCCVCLLAVEADKKVFWDRRGFREQRIRREELTSWTSPKERYLPSGGGGGGMRQRSSGGRERLLEVSFWDGFPADCCGSESSGFGASRSSCRRSRFCGVKDLEKGGGAGKAALMALGFGFAIVEK